MGDGPRWSTDSYVNTRSLRAASGASAFAYHDAVSKQVASDRKIHPSLDPKNIKNVRESRDSTTCPESLAIIVGLDITGSMRDNPKVVQQKLPILMDGLVQSGFVTDPHVMISAFGDAYSDRAVLQTGQFEVGNEIENDVGNLWMEGGGGGSDEESSELLLWFAAHKTAIDCVEKRNKKGYLFIISDEMAYRDIPKSVLEAVFGDNALEATDTTLDEVLQLAKEKFNIFYVLPKDSAHFGDRQVHGFWKSRLGSNFVRLHNISCVNELIVSIIAKQEGKDAQAISDWLEAVCSSEDATAIQRVLTGLESEAAVL